MGEWGGEEIWQDHLGATVGRSTLKKKSGSSHVTPRFVFFPSTPKVTKKTTAKADLPPDIRQIWKRF